MIGYRISAIIIAHPFILAMKNCNLFRAELLKAIKYREISYSKFCKKEYFALDRKQNRVFVGLYDLSDWSDPGIFFLLKAFNEQYKAG